MDKNSDLKMPPPPASAPEVSDAKASRICAEIDTMLKQDPPSTTEVQAAWKEARENPSLA